MFASSARVLLIDSFGKAAPRTAGVVDERCAGRAGAVGLVSLDQLVFSVPIDE